MEENNNKKILVTGGAGYIGCVLVPKLLAKGYQVRVYDTLFFGDNGLKDVQNQIELVKGDIRSFDERILDGVEAVINLAAFSNDPTAETNPGANMEINVYGALNVAAAAKKQGIKRFIQASSCSIYYSHADYEDDSLRTEKSEVNPTAPYSLSKKKAEDGLLAMMDGDFCPVMLRKATVSGFSPRMRYDLLLNTLCRDAFQKGKINLLGGGENWRPLVHIDDAAEAYVELVNAPMEKIRGQIFNLVYKNYRISEIGLWLKNVLRDRRNIEVECNYDDINSRARSYRASSEKINNILKIIPYRGAALCINELWDKMSAGQYIDFDNPAYYNIKWMQAGKIY